MTRRGNPTIQMHIAWEEANRLNTRVTITCGFCEEFTTTDTMYFARRAHQQHRKQHHPQAVTKRRHRHGKGPTMGTSKPIDENIANARLQGASSWDGATE